MQTFFRLNILQATMRYYIKPNITFLFPIGIMQSIFSNYQEYLEGFETLFRDHPGLQESSGVSSNFTREIFGTSWDILKKYLAELHRFFKN